MRLFSVHAAPKLTEALHTEDDSWIHNQVSSPYGEQTEMSCCWAFIVIEKQKEFFKETWTKGFPLLTFFTGQEMRKSKKQ